MVTDFGDVMRWLIPLFMAFSAGVGAYVGVLKAIGTLRLELHRELARRDVTLVQHEERLRTVEETVRDLRSEV